MIVEDKKTVAMFMGPGFCECGCRWYGPLDPNHIIQKGPGGGSRLDIPANLLGLRREPCHNRYHDCRPGSPGHNEQKKRFLAIVAKREGFESGQDLQEWLWLVLRTPKGQPMPVMPVRF